MQDLRKMDEGARELGFASYAELVKQAEDARRRYCELCGYCADLETGDYWNDREESPERTNR